MASSAALESTLPKTAPPKLLGGSTDPHDVLRAAPKVKIKIHRTGNPNEAPDVYVGVNGVGFQIKRGETVEVPEPVAKALENAIQTVYTETKEDGKVVLKPNAVPAYPFTRLN